MTGVTGATGSPIQIDQDALHAGMPAKTIKQGNENSATASDHSNSQAGADTCPTAGGREVTSTVPLTHDEIERATEERLMQDPEYRELKERSELCKDLLDMVLLVDANTGLVTSDGSIELANVKWLLNSDDPKVQAAAKFLNEHMDIWREIAGTDNWTGTDAVKAFIAGMKDQLKSMRATARGEIKAEDAARVGAAATAAGAAATGQTGGTGQAAGASQTAADPKALLAEADQALPKPAPSQFSGLEGASENLNNMVGWAEAEMDRITKLMGKTDDPAVLKQLEMKINQMSRRMQQMTALMNQIMTAMQNISKMYSDIAMNSVRNMR